MSAAGSAKSQSPQALHTLSSRALTSNRMDGNENGKDKHYDSVRARVKPGSRRARVCSYCKVSRNFYEVLVLDLRIQPYGTCQTPEKQAVSSINSLGNYAIIII